MKQNFESLNIMELEIKCIAEPKEDAIMATSVKPFEAETKSISSFQASAAVTDTQNGLELSHTLMSPNNHSNFSSEQPSNFSRQMVLNSPMQRSPAAVTPKTNARESSWPTDPESEILNAQSALDLRTPQTKGQMPD